MGCEELEKKDIMKMQNSQKSFAGQKQDSSRDVPLFIEEKSILKKLYADKEWKKLIVYLEGLLLDYPEHRGELFYYVGMVQELMGNMELAEAAYRQAVCEEHINYWLYYQLGQFYHRQQNFKEEQYVYNVAYKKYILKDLEERSVDDGIMYILSELIKYADAKKKKIKAIAYRKRKSIIEERYKLFKEHEIYSL